MCKYVSVCRFVYLRAVFLESREGMGFPGAGEDMGFPGAGVACRCKLGCMCPRNQTQVLCGNIIYS